MTLVIANWRDANAYPKWGKSSLTRFAWEFLRRNPEYQKDWADYLNICRGILPHYDPRIPLNQEDYDKLEYHANHLNFDPPRLAEESKSEWRVRVKKGRTTLLPVWYARKWGIKHSIYDPYYPYEEDLPPVFFENAHTSSFITQHWPGFSEADDNGILKPTLAMAFGLSLPIDAQIEAARRALLARQRSLINKGVITSFPDKVPRKEWIIYLRLLDAEAAGVKPKEMASCLYPDEEDVYPDYIPQKKARSALTQAKKWRDSWYRFIPSLQLPKKK
jgi:hypothetical protein